MTPDDRSIVCWQVETPFPGERLMDTTREDAIRRHLDDYPESPDVVTLVGYARMRVTAGSLPELVVEYVLEAWAEEYGDPDGDYEAPITDAMREAADAFLAVLAREYRPWACEPVVREEVDLSGWRKP